MNTDATESVVAAQLAALPPLLAATDKTARRLDLTPGTQKKVRLVVEELFTNTVKHGYGSDCDEPVRVALLPGENGLVTLRYRDGAPAFDPTRFDRKSRSTADGGFGLLLVRGVAHAMRYRREDEANIVELDLVADTGR